MNLGRNLIPLIEPISLLWLALILLAVLLWRKRARGFAIVVVPVPGNFHPRQNRGFRALRRAIPGTLGFEKTSVWLPEKIGWWEYRRRGWIPAP